MSEKPFRLGLIVGRFQIFHKGHEDILNKACSVCDRVCLFIGSAQEEGTEKNPFSYELRKQIIGSLSPDNVDIFPLPDAGLGNNCRWGSYVIEKAIEAEGVKPDLVISGKENRRVSWYENEDVAELTVPKTIDICASTLRQLLAEDCKEEFFTFVNPLLIPFYDEMRALIIKSKNNTQTESI